MQIYFVLNALSLFWAATDLLLVLVFLLPGKIRQFRGSDQVSGQATHPTTLERMAWRLCRCIPVAGQPRYSMACRQQLMLAG